MFQDISAARANESFSNIKLVIIKEIVTRILHLKWGQICQIKLNTRERNKKYLNAADNEMINGRRHKQCLASVWFGLV